MDAVAAHELYGVGPGSGGSRASSRTASEASFGQAPRQRSGRERVRTARHVADVAARYDSDAGVMAALPSPAVSVQSFRGQPKFDAGADVVPRLPSASMSAASQSNNAVPGGAAGGQRKKKIIAVQVFEDPTGRDTQSAAQLVQKLLLQSNNAMSKLRNCPGLEHVTAAFMAPRGKSIEEIIELYGSNTYQVPSDVCMMM
eukprot:Tamp_30593.p2 GENE.Tamp_30593~~Tamp_30593.p2  ORF type:complete len:213 (+),score=28.82 Tamp_30593:41-640(+)